MKCDIVKKVRLKQCSYLLLEKTALIVTFFALQERQKKTESHAKHSYYGQVPGHFNTGRFEL